MSHAVEIRDADDADLAGLARLHIQAFPGSVLGELGEEAVRRNYRWQLNGPHDLTALVAADDGQMLGFLFGGVFRGSTIGFVKAERWFLAGQVARHPRILLRGVGWSRVGLALRLLARRSPTAQPEQPDAVPRRSLGVLAIAVDPGAQGRGVGRALMAEATRRARRQGFESMHLTVHPSNEQALGFYRSLGWRELPEQDGRWVGRMSFDLSEVG
jgi:ribosomal protein S18 acetylase RimI-like enzyme